MAASVAAMRRRSIRLMMAPIIAPLHRTTPAL